MNFPSLPGIQPLMPLQTLQSLRPPEIPGPGRIAENISQLRDAGAAAGLQNQPDTFDSLFQAYIGMINSAGLVEAQSQHLQIEYALGNHDDMLAVVLAQEMAFTSLHFAVQVTNRMIEAYREIMRMQI